MSAQSNHQGLNEDVWRPCAYFRLVVPLTHDLNILIPSRSRDWECPHCKVPNKELLPDPTPDSAKPTSGGPVSEQPPALESPKDTSEACSAGIPVTPKASEAQGGSNEKASLDDREIGRAHV